MRFLSLFLLGALLLTAMSACERTLTFLAGEDWQTGKIYTRTHWSGSNADATALTYVTANTQQAWEDLWQRTGEAAPGPLPEGKMGVAVLLGQRPNPGWRVEITKAGKEFVFGQVEEYRVEYRVLEPDPSKVYPQTVASPWAIRLAEFSDRVVDYNEVK